MMNRATIPAILIAFTLVSPLARAQGVPKWKQHTINPTSQFEAAGVFDVDGDGHLDIVCGDTWYRGPDFQESHPVREVSKTGTYYNCFATLPMDVNGNGRTDFITVSYFGNNVGWVENPGEPGREWSYHPIDEPGPSEAAQLVDLTGDGELEVLPNPVNVVVWYKLVEAGPEPKWRKYDFGTEAAGHGIGAGDVNGDGRTDILTPKGWFEAPENPAEESWTWYPEWNAGATGILMLARDVDGDGLADVVYGMGHDYGLYWLKQGRGPDGQRTWTRHTIDETIASVHTLIWADINGDGHEHELVTGKRVYAHEVEPGDTDASVIAWYAFDTDRQEWRKHVIFEGEPAENAPEDGAQRDALRDFPPGTAGTGLQMVPIDINGNGRTDLVCPGKSGLYLFENLGTEP